MRLRQVNRLLFLFFGFVAILIFGAWQTIQSNWFGNITADYIAEYVSRNFDVDIEVESFKFRFFPVGTAIHGLRFIDREEKIDFYSDKVELKFSLVSLIQSNFEIESIEINRGKLFYDIDLSSIEETVDDQEEATPQDFEYKTISNYYSEYFSLVKNTVDTELPVKVRSLELRDFSVQNEEVELHIAYFMGKNLDGMLEVELELESLDLEKYTNGKNDFHLDNFRISLQASKNRLRVTELEIFSELSVVSMTGYFDMDGRTYASGYYRGDATRITELLGEDLSSVIESGYLDLDFYVDGESYNFDTVANMSVYELITPYARLDKASAEVHIRNGDVSVQSLELESNGGKLELLGKLELPKDWSPGQLHADASFHVDNFHTNDLLYFLRDQLDILEARVFGQVDVSLTKKDIHITLADGFEARGLKLQNPLVEVPILDLGNIQLDKSLIHLEDYGRIVNLDMGIEKKDTYIPVYGFIGEGELLFEANEALVNLKDIGAISGVVLEGVGLLEMKISGPLDDVNFDFAIDMENSQVVDIFLGDLESSIEYRLGENKLLIKGADSSVGETRVSGKGEFDFNTGEDVENMNLDIDVHRGSYQDIFKILKGPLADLDFLDVPVKYFFSGDLHIGGGFEPEEILISGALKGRELQVHDEDFSMLGFDLSLEKNIVGFENIELRKGQGRLGGYFKANIETGEIDYNFDVGSVQLNSINAYEALGLGLDGTIEGEFSGRGIGSAFTSYSILNLNESRIFNLDVEDSRVELISDGEEIFVNGYLLGEMISLDSFFDLSERIEKKSYLNLSVRADDVNKLFGILSAHNIKDESLEGRISFDVRSQFNFYELSDVNGEIDFLHFGLKKNGFELDLNLEQSSVVRIREGEILDWDIELVGNEDNIFRSRGSGNFRDEFEVVNNIDIKADIIEVFSDKLQSASGHILAESIISGRIDDLNHLTRFLASDLALRVEGVPGVISEGVVDFVIDEKDLLLQNVNFRYGKGVIRAAGGAELNFPYPSIDIRWVINNAMVPVLRRSQVSLSGAGEFVGDSIPYLLRGSINILHGQILDSMDDFQQTSGQLEAYNRFIPRQQLGERVELVRLDLLVDIERPIQMRNALTELFLEGGVRVSGGIENPLVNGEISVIPERSRFKFKGYDFVLSEGSVRFTDTESKESPVLGFVGSSQIGQYQVNVEVSGRTENVSIIMTSDPPLGQDDILSLLTLGVTRSISQGLDESERQQLTTIGLGALLFDQFQLTEGLTSSFGLRFSVAPEISENESSLIQGRYGVTDSGSTRVRSATRVRVQRRISDKVDLSVSSTVGGSLEQRQEMNVNYRFSDRVSIEGVYEMKSREENVTNTPDSIGLDLKWRWSF